MLGGQSIIEPLRARRLHSVASWLQRREGKGAVTVHILGQGLQLCRVDHFLNLQSLQLLLERLDLSLQALKLGLHTSRCSANGTSARRAGGGGGPSEDRGTLRLKSCRSDRVHLPPGLKALLDLSAPVCTIFAAYLRHYDVMNVGSSTTQHHWRVTVNYAPQAL